MLKDKIIQKDVSVSAAKAIGIILMVYAHCTTPNFFHGVIGSFHMPLFFFFSGYCFKDLYLLNFKDFARKRITGLYRPFVVWGLFFLILHNFFFYINFYNDEYGHIYRGGVSRYYTLVETIKRGGYIILTLTKNEQMLGGYWFLHDLFYASFISFFIIKYIKNPYWGLIIALSISMILQYTNFQVPYFTINGRCFLAISFFLTGRIIKTTNIPLTNWCTRIVMTFFLLLGILLGAVFIRKSMLSITWQLLIPYYYCAVCYIIIVKFVCNYLKPDKHITKCISYVGNNSLTILTWHFLVLRFVSLLLVYIYGLPIKMVGCHPIIADYSNKGWWIIYLAAGITIPCLIAKLHKYTFFRWLHI